MENGNRGIEIQIWKEEHKNKKQRLFFKVVKSRDEGTWLTKTSSQMWLLVITETQASVQRSRGKENTLTFLIILVQDT